MVNSVSDGGPAGKAGLSREDIIVALNDKPVKDGPDLINHVADLPIGSIATITVDRNGKRADFKVAIGERSQVWKDSPQVTQYEPKDPVPLCPRLTKHPPPIKFGITIQRLSDKERQDLAIQDKTGVKVVSVDPGSFADDIGMQDGDTILSINRMPISVQMTSCVPRRASSPGNLLPCMSLAAAVSTLRRSASICPAIYRTSSWHTAPYTDT